MKILRKVKFSQKRLGEAITIVSGMLIIPVGIFKVNSRTKSLCEVYSKVNNTEIRTTSVTLLLVSLLLIMNKFTPSFSVFIVNVEQVNACSDDNDNNNDGSSHDEDVNRTDITMNLISFL